MNLNFESQLSPFGGIIKTGIKRSEILAVMQIYRISKNKMVKTMKKIIVMEQAALKALNNNS